MHTDNLPQQVPLLIDGQWTETHERVSACNPFTGSSDFSVCECSDELLERALAAANVAKAGIADMPARDRAALLRQAAEGIRRHSAWIARIMAIETGKPVVDGLTEVLRSAETFELSAQEAVRIEGAHIPMDSSVIGAGKLGVSLRFPVGVVAAITPFNAPVNLTAHKLGPAWAAGNAVVLKPSPQSALTIYTLVKVLLEAGIPASWIQMVQGDRAAAQLVASSQADFVSFTGSSRIGERVKANSGLKRVALELGGNGFTVIAADAPLEEAAQACARNSMRLAGQSCISVQNVLVHRSLYEAFTARVAEIVQTLRVGDPLDERTEVGPVISVHSARRIQGLVDGAVAAGAKLVCGGSHKGALVQPTVLADVPWHCEAMQDEVFGPVVLLAPFDDAQQVFDLMRALRMGAVIVNGTSTWRSDQAPYGGVKASGIGREGPRFAIQDMSEERFVVFNV